MVSISMSFVKPFAIQLLLVVACLSVALLTEGWVKYAIGGCLILASGVYALVGLEKRIQIGSALIQRIRKNNL